MTDSSTHTILFELQKNLEDLSSAKIQMEEFRSSSINVVQGIGNVQEKFVKHLTDLETDYKQRVNKLEENLTSFLSTNEDKNKTAIEKVVSTSQHSISLLEKNLASFLTSNKDENKTAIEKLVSSSENTVNQGIAKFENIASKVELSNGEYISAIARLLEHYKSVVEASRSLIDTLSAIDFPSKLDALSSKTQLIIETITNAKQALELKSNETLTSINYKTAAARDQIIQNTETKFQSLAEQVNNSKEILAKTVSDKFSEQSTQFKSIFENLNNTVIVNSTILQQRQDKQDKQIKVLKMIAIAITIISSLGIIATIFVLKKP